MNKHFLRSTAALTLILSVLLIAIPISSGQSSAQNTITQAQTTLKNCYSALSEAASAGANVDTMLVTLNEAAERLSMAELAQASGNITSAFTYANDAQSKLNGFEPQAEALKQSALTSSAQNMLFRFLSLAGSVTVLLVGVFVWFILNRGERRRSYETSTI